MQDKADREHSTKVTVFGGGAVGLFLVAHLSQLDNIELSLVCRGDTFDACSKTGCVQVTDKNSGRVINASNFRVVDTTQTRTLGPQVHVISCVKGNQLPDACEALQHLVGNQTCCVFVQNGLPFFHNFLTSHPALSGSPLTSVDPGAALLQRFDPKESLTAACVTHIAVARTAPNAVLWTSRREVTKFTMGCAPSGANSAQLAPLVDLMQQAGLQAYVDDDMLSCIWRKVCVSAAVNTTNLLTRGLCDALIRDEGMAALIEAIIREVISVGEVIGVAFEFTAAEKVQWCRKQFPACKFSMLQDAEAGKPLEVAPYVSAVQEVAQCVGVATPTLDIVSTMVQHYDSNLRNGVCAQG